ncbi:hypothetical protein JTE90_008530 [Oedothorax gibbosus]|uniref:Uncharacterized protein n=1 Tax=Oedothorax gibbosus TaxID=931172 RepID=A0AAV6VGV5_9ARAC|nr:hypothetical protein JTE90_008530 [Oedothorax gibbosus]
MQVQKTSVFFNEESFAFADTQGLFKSRYACSNTVKKHALHPSVNILFSCPSTKVSKENYRCDKDTRLSDPNNGQVVDNLVQGLQTKNSALLNMVPLCSDNHDQLIGSSINSSRKWLKEILSHNLEYLRNHQDLHSILNQIKDFIEKLRVSDTLTKLSKIRGLLNLQRIQLSSINQDSMDSDTQDKGEL